MEELQLTKVAPISDIEVCVCGHALNYHHPLLQKLFMCIRCARSVFHQFKLNLDKIERKTKHLQTNQIDDV
jgi:hypothetical protein